MHIAESLVHSAFRLISKAGKFIFHIAGSTIAPDDPMEETARQIASYLSIGIELLGAAIIGIALIRFIISFIPSLVRKKSYVSNAWLRVQFGSSLALALELLLAADILRTAIAPTWDDIGKLAAIAAIRTALNFFLERELKGMEKRMSGESSET